MQAELRPHPTTPQPAVERLLVEVQRTVERLELRYVLTGDLDRLVIPPPAPPARADELWRRTCFEAFVAGEGDGYVELNLSPSGQWAAYSFEGYRQGMAPLEIVPPAIDVHRGDRTLELLATVALVEGGRLGLSAVIEAADGALAYFALAHPPGRPDFHAADCFALELPAIQRP